MTEEDKVELYKQQSNEYADEIKRYSDCIQDIKSRLLTIKKCVANPGYFDNYLEVEFVCLQFRSILELIILSSLVNHAKEYNKTSEELKNLWRIKPIMKNLEELNKDYFPVPISIGSVEPFDLKKLDDKISVLKKEEILDFYDSLSDYTHPKNPFATPKDAVGMWNNFHTWWRKITNLMNVHIIQPLNLNVKFVVMSNFDNDKSPQIMFLQIAE